MPTVLLILLLVLAAVLLFRTARFKPREQPVSANPVEVSDPEGAVRRFSAIL